MSERSSLIPLPPDYRCDMTTALRLLSLCFQQSDGLPLLRMGLKKSPSFLN